MEGDSNIEKGSNWFVRTDLGLFLREAKKHTETLIQIQGGEKMIETQVIEAIRQDYLYSNRNSQMALIF